MPYLCFDRLFEILQRVALAFDIFKPIRSFFYTCTAPYLFHSSLFQMRFFQVLLSLPLMHYFLARGKKNISYRAILESKNVLVSCFFFKKNIFLNVLFKVENDFLKLLENYISIVKLAIYWLKKRKLKKYK